LPHPIALAVKIFCDSRSRWQWR